MSRHADRHSQPDANATAIAVVVQHGEASRRRDQGGNGLISLGVAHFMRRCRESARSLNPEDANCGKAAANLAYIRLEFGTESGILSGVEERSPFGSKVALPPINPTPNSVPVFGTEFGAVFRPAYYILI